MEASNKRQTSFKKLNGWYIKKESTLSTDFLSLPAFAFSKTAATYSSTVTQHHRRDERLNFSVRMGKRWILVL